MRRNLPTDPHRWMIDALSIASVLILMALCATATPRVVFVVDDPGGDLEAEAAAPEAPLAHTQQHPLAVFLGERDDVHPVGRDDAVDVQLAATRLRSDAVAAHGEDMALVRLAARQLLERKQLRRVRVSAPSLGTHG